MERVLQPVRTVSRQFIQRIRHADHVVSPLLFWRRSLAHPVQISSVFPSRPSVGRHLFEAVANETAGPVVELGAGTGAVTQQLLKGGIVPERLSLVELDSAFAVYLRRHFPQVEVLEMPADEVADVWRQTGRDPIGAVVSTLPIKLFSPEQQRRVVETLFGVMAPGAPFVQLTYRLSSPIDPEILAAFGIEGRRFRIVWRSLPPAFLWLYRRRPN